MPRRAIDLAAVGRAAGAGGMAGAIAGVLVGGFGSRIAMRVSGAMTAPELMGAATANGNRVGDITLGGGGADDRRPRRAPLVRRVCRPASLARLLIRPPPLRLGRALSCYAANRP